LYYYGARYMQPITSVWYGIDPLTEKYPEISGYVYCHGNPITLVDLDGKTDYYNQKGILVKSDKDGESIKKMLFISSKKLKDVDDAINKKAYIIVPSNTIIYTMEKAYELTEASGNEHGFRVGKNGMVSIIVEGKPKSIDHDDWLPAARDLREKGDYVSYDVHTHPKPPYDGGPNIPFNNQPSDTDINNTVGDQPNVVLGYNFTYFQNSNQIGGQPEVKFDRYIRFFNNEGAINSIDYKFSEFKRAVIKINKNEN